MKATKRKRKKKEEKGTWRWRFCVSSREFDAWNSLDYVCCCCCSSHISLPSKSSQLYLPLSLPLSIMWTMIYLSGLDPTSLKYIGLGLADWMRLGKPNKTPWPFKFFLNRPLTYFSFQLNKSDKTKKKCKEIYR